MERIRYRTTCFGWYDVGMIIPGNPIKPGDENDENYEWELISTNIVQGQIPISYSATGSSTASGIAWGSTNGDKFLIVWTWVGKFRASNAVEASELKVI